MANGKGCGIQCLVGDDAGERCVDCCKKGVGFGDIRESLVSDPAFVKHLVAEFGEDARVALFCDYADNSLPRDESVDPEGLDRFNKRVRPARELRIVGLGKPDVADDMHANIVDRHLRAGRGDKSSFDEQRFA